MDLTRILLKNGKDREKKLWKTLQVLKSWKSSELFHFQKIMHLKRKSSLLVVVETKKNSEQTRKILD